MIGRCARLVLVTVLVGPVLGACASGPSAESVALTQVATATVQRGDTKAAQDLYQRALAEDSDNLDALRGLGLIQEQNGDRDGAIKTYEHAADLAPKDADLARILGRLLLKAERPMDAKKAFERALQYDPKNPKLLGELAVALDMTSEHAAAQEKYAEALRLDPQNLTLINNLAYSHILGQDFGGAINLLEPLIKDPRASMALRQNLGLAYGLSGMETDALRVLRMDFPPAKAQETLASYKRRRAEIIVSVSPYVELGTYATQDLAAAAVGRLQPRLLAAGGDMKPVIAPEVSAPGGTPRFALRLMSCAKPDELKRFCADLVKSGVPCKPFGG